MKIRFYCDVPPNFCQANNTLCGATNPNWTKPPDFIRIAFDVEIPEELCNGGADVELPITKAMPVSPELCQRQK